VVLDLDASAERRLKGSRVRRGDGTPADGVEERIQPCRIVEPRRLGQCHPLVGVRSQLSNSLELLAVAIILHGGQGDEVLWPIGAWTGGMGHESGLLHFQNDEAALSDFDKLPWIGRSESNGHRWHHANFVEARTSPAIPNGCPKSSSGSSGCRLQVGAGNRSHLYECEAR
jgi:hypothetical protein